MSSTPFELELVGGPWAKRLARRRAGFDAWPWHEAAAGLPEAGLAAARRVWTRSAFSEYASAAAFAEIAARLLECGAPLDFVAAAGDFVAEETIHAELAARVAAAMGGAIALEVDLEKLVRPPSSDAPLLRAAELLVRTSCVGETLTVPVLKAERAAAGSPLVEVVIDRIVEDESAHAQLGPWFLDWAAPRLTDLDRAHLGEVAGAAVRAFAPIFTGACAAAPGGGVVDCATFDVAFFDALDHRVVRDLAARGIEIPADDLAAVRGAAAHQPGKNFM